MSRKQSRTITVDVIILAICSGCEGQTGALVTHPSEPAPQAFPIVEKGACTAADLDCIFDRICNEIVELRDRFPRLREISLMDCRRYERGNGPCYSIHFERGALKVPNPRYDPSSGKKQSAFLRQYDPETGVRIYLMFLNGSCPVPAKSMRGGRLGAFGFLLDVEGPDQAIHRAILSILHRENASLVDAL